MPTKEPRSLVQSVSNTSELRMARHSSTCMIARKKKEKRVSVFKNAEQRCIEQSRIEERERGPKAQDSTEVSTDTHTDFSESQTL